MCSSAREEEIQVRNLLTEPGIGNDLRAVRIEAG